MNTPSQPEFLEGVVKFFSVEKSWKFFRYGMDHFFQRRFHSCPLWLPTYVKSTVKIKHSSLLGFCMKNLTELIRLHTKFQSISMSGKTSRRKKHQKLLQLITKVQSNINVQLAIKMEKVQRIMVIFLTRRKIKILVLYFYGISLKEFY